LNHQIYQGFDLKTKDRYRSVSASSFTDKRQDVKLLKENNPYLPSRIPAMRESYQHKTIVKEEKTSI